MERFTKKKSEKKTEIEYLEKRKKEVLSKRNSTAYKIPFNQLPDNLKFDTAVNERNFFLDIIKIIVYRSETAMCNIIKELMSNPQEARSLMRRLYSADADIETDLVNNILKVNIHNTNNWADDKILKKLCEDMNETQTVFPSTNLTLQFKLVTS